MGERWIRSCRAALKNIRVLSKVEDKDRLDLVNSMKISLVFMSKSLKGWTNWVNNPEIIARFNQEELEEMEERIILFAESFIEYDLKTTELGLEKGLRRKKSNLDRKKIRFII